jgi:hypothetical protein
LENTGPVAAHWLVHVPLRRLSVFRGRLPIWVEKAAGPITAPNTIDVRPAPTPLGCRKYMLKGIDPAYAPLYKIDHIPQGSIQGKRFGFSLSIGPSQCLKHGTKKPWRRPKGGPPPWMMQNAAQERTVAPAPTSTDS